MPRRENKPEMTAEQARLINALLGATEGVCCAVERESISSEQIDCLFNSLIDRLKATFR